MSETSRNIHEEKERPADIAELLKRAEQLIDDNFDVQTERNKRGELAFAGKLSSEEMEEEYRNRGEFLLPKRDGVQTLDIHLLAADPYVDPHNPESFYAEYGPDAIAKFVHDKRGESGDMDMEIKDVYIIRQTPDGDLILEKSLRDHTLSNKEFGKLRDIAQNNIGHAALVGESIEQYMLDEADRKRAEGSVLLEERQFGLHFAGDEDKDELQKLLGEAEPRR